MYSRIALQEQIERGFRSHSVVTLLGPRQCGKTTLAKAFATGRESHFLDLEDPRDAARLANPMLILGSLTGLIVLDEVQRRPELLPVLRVLADRVGNSTRFLLLGSASAALVKGVSESLAGRTAYVDMEGFSLAEVGPQHWQKLWFRGSFPRSYLAKDDQIAGDWREDYLRSLLERDLPQLGVSIPAATLRRFWTMVAHYHGQLWNQAELARSMGTSEKTAGRYLEILEGTFMVRLLRPWHENLGKRLVKSPKLYVADSGLAHQLLGIGSMPQLWSHPKVGASWEGFCLSEVLRRFGEAKPWFYATQGGAELDVLLELEGKRYGFEIKLNEAPRLTRSMVVAQKDLSLDHLWVIYPGNVSYPLAEGIETLPIEKLATLELGA